jgi:hypothetical protein
MNTTPAPAKADPVLSTSVELARTAAVDVGGDAVGEHISLDCTQDRAVTHGFASLAPGYRGWYWAVTLTRPPRSRAGTVAEVVMLPGDGALLAPEWVPWDRRVEPGDLGPGDLLPADPDDPRIVPAYVHSDDPAVEDASFELGLGRPRVMSREGRFDAAERWQHGAAGPDTPMARQAPATCGTCAFLLPLAGSLSAAFGVCGNELTAVDGHVVSVEYGCGAHSEARVDIPPLSEPGELVYDDGDALLP